MISDTSLKVDHVSKVFKLPHERHSSLKQTVLNLHRRRFEKLQVLKNINFEVKKGEFFGVVGRNGSGKSTLLKIMAGIYEPTAGKIEINGHLTPFIELGVGFNAELTGKDNIFLNGAILGLTRKQIADKYEAIVKFAELEKFMDQKLKNYSSGMLVRLAFSIAIQAHHDILLIDEVLAVGDASFQRKCFNIFKDIKRQGKTVIFVSHDMSAVKEYCDRAVLIEKGKVISSGTAEKVANAYIQMFNTNQVESNKTTKRWGDKRAVISNPKVKVDKSEVVISYKLTARQRINNPICGIIIKNLDNNHIINSNTKWGGVKVGQIKPNESVQVSWSLPHILKNGKYYLTVAAAHEDGLGYYDWREEVLSFNVMRPEQTDGLVAVKDTIEVTRVT